MKYLVTTIRSISFHLIFILLEVRNIYGFVRSTYVERKLFCEYCSGWGYLEFKSDSKMIADPKKACVSAYVNSRNYVRSSGSRAFGIKNITMKQVKSTEFSPAFNLKGPIPLMVQILKCVFPNGDTFALTAGGFMISFTRSSMMEHIPALADKRCADCFDKVKKKCLSFPNYEHCNARNLGGDELDEENVLFHRYIEGLEHLQFSSDSKVTTNLSRACVIAYENSRQYVTFNSQGVLSRDKKFIMQSVSAEIDLKFSLKGKVFSEVVKCKFENDNFAITPGGFLVSVINFKIMEHIPELADEKCLDLIYQSLWMETPAYMTGKATSAEEIALFHNYCTGERLQFEEGSKMTTNLPLTCVTAYNTSQSYGRSSDKQKPSNKDVNLILVKSAEIDDLILVKSPTKNVMSKVVKCWFKNGEKFAIAPGGFLVSLDNFKIVEHVPALSDKNCLNLIKAMKIYGVK